jgi:hypothetical protein
MKYTKTVQFLAILCSAVFLTACNNESKLEDKKNKSPQVVKFICDVKMVNENPESTVKLSVDDKLFEISLNKSDCGDIKKEDYSQFKIPEQAVAACGGWWAGSGDYFYAEIKDGKLSVFQGWMDSEQEDDGYHWKEIKLKEN